MFLTEAGTDVCRRPPPPHPLLRISGKQTQIENSGDPAAQTCHNNLFEGWRGNLVCGIWLSGSCCDIQWFRFSHLHTRASQNYLSGVLEVRWGSREKHLGTLNKSTVFTLPDEQVHSVTLGRASKRTGRQVEVWSLLGDPLPAANISHKTGSLGSFLPELLFSFFSFMAILKVFRFNICWAHYIHYIQYIRLMENILGPNHLPSLNHSLFWPLPWGFKSPQFSSSISDLIKPWWFFF